MLRMYRCLEDARSTYDDGQKAQVVKRCQTINLNRLSYYQRTRHQPGNWVYRSDLKGIGANCTTRVWGLRHAELNK